MTSYLVPGSPYMTFEYKSATPSLKTMNGGITSFNGKSLSSGQSCTYYHTKNTLYIIHTLTRGQASATGTTFTVTDTKDVTYLIYALSSITLTAKADSTTSGTVSASSAYTGVLRLVKLADPAHKALLDQHYQVYPTAAALDYSFTDTTGTVIFQWPTVGNGADLLMLTWPHHRMKMLNPNFPATTALGYLTTKVCTVVNDMYM